MSLIKCNECGKEISDKAETCPNCGCPIELTKKREDIIFNINNINVNMDEIMKLSNYDKFHASKKIVELTQIDKKIANKAIDDYFNIVRPINKSKNNINSNTNQKNKNDSVLSIISFIISICGCGYISIIGVILAIIDLVKSKNNKDNKQHGWSIAAICIFFAWIFFFSYINNNTDSPDKSKEIVKSESSNENNTKLNFSTEEIYNKNDCIISIVSNDEKSITFCIENNSSKDYGFYAHAISINGIMTNCNIYTMDTDVPSGKKANATITFESDWIDKCGDVEYIDVIFWAYDHETNMKDFDTGIINMKSNKYTSDKIVEPAASPIDMNNVNVSIVEILNDKAIIQITNNSNDYISIDVDNASINEWAYDNSFDTMDVYIFPKNTIQLELEIDSSFKEEHKIDSVDFIEFSLNIRPNGDYGNEIKTEKIEFIK